MKLSVHQASRIGDLPPRAASFFSSEALPEKDIFGYDEQIKAGLGMGLEAAKGKSGRVLIFGYPGTGKSAFPFTLARRLNADFDKRFSLTYISCESFYVLSEMENLKKDLDQLAEKVCQNRPAIFSIDETDALTVPIYKARSTLRILSQWLLDFMDHCRDQILLFGIANHPEKMDNSFLRRFQVRLYFEPTDSGVIRRILKRYLNIDNDERVTRVLLKKFEEYDLRLMSSDLIDACEEIRTSVGSLKGLPVQEVVKTLQYHISPCNCAHYIDDYEKQNRNLINFSRDYILPYWKVIYDRMTTF